MEKATITSTRTTGSGGGGGGGSSSSPRDKFSNKVEYVVTALSFAVGLGNIWRFPYLCYRNGGGSFFIPYLLSLIFLGITFYFFESSLGQYTSLGPIEVWRMTPIFKGIGLAMYIVCAYDAYYYNMLVAWAMYYLYSSFTTMPSVPWAFCNNTWNTVNCVDYHPSSGPIVGNNSISRNLVKPINSTATPTSIITTIDGSTTSVSMNLSMNKIEHHIRSPSEEFFYNNLLVMSDDIGIIGSLQSHLVLCLAISWLMVFLGLSLGARSLGKISYFTAIFPYVMITALLIKGVQLDGAMDGIMHYLTPNIERLTHIEVWSDAGTQIFFSLSICIGGVITLSSYNPFHNNMFQDSLMIVILNSATSIYAGFAIFSVIGFMAKQIDKPFDEAADHGVGLAFVAYPAALARMPLSPLWSAIFFFMIITLGFGSELSLVETVVAITVDLDPDRLQHRKALVTAIVCFVMFVGGLPLCTNAGVYILQLVDNYAVPYSPLVIGCCEMIAIAWFYGVDRHLDNIKRMIGFEIRPRAYWRFMFSFGTPAIMIAMLVLVFVNVSPLRYNDYVYPQYANTIGWLLAASSVIMIPLVAMYQCIRVCFGQVTLKNILCPEIEFHEEEQQQEKQDQIQQQQQQPQKQEQQSPR